MDLLETLFKKIFFCFSDAEDDHILPASSLSILTDSNLSAPVHPCQYPNSLLRHSRARRPMPPQPTSPYSFRTGVHRWTSNSSNESQFSAPIDDPALRFLTNSLKPQMAYAYHMRNAQGLVPESTTTAMTSGRAASVRSRNALSRNTNVPLSYGRHGHGQGMTDIKADSFSGLGNIKVAGVGQGGSFPRSTAMPRYPSVNRKMGVPQQGTRTHIRDVSYSSYDNSDYGMGFIGRNCRIA